MAIVTMPAALRCAAGCRIEQITSEALTVSDPAGTSQARSYGAPRWALSLVAPTALTDADAGVWKAMLLGLRGSVNHLAAYDPTRTEPVGTLRGNPTLGAAAAAGSAALLLACGAGQAGRTLQPGDWLQLGAGLGSSQLVMCVAAAVADGAGAMAVAIEPPLRLAFASGAVVTWQRPTAYFRKLPGRVGWSPYSRRLTQGLSLDLVEAW